jgi:hypothetical protein
MQRYVSCWFVHIHFYLPRHLEIYTRKMSLPHFHKRHFRTQFLLNVRFLEFQAALTTFEFHVFIRVMTNPGLHRAFILQDGRHRLWRTLAVRELLFCRMADTSYDEPMFLYFFLNSLSGGWSPTGSTRNGGHWLAYGSLPQVIMMLENLGEWRLGGETEVLGENRPQRHFTQSSYSAGVLFSKWSARLTTNPGS